MIDRLEFDQSVSGLGRLQLCSAAFEGRQLPLTHDSIVHHPVSVVSVVSVVWFGFTAPPEKYLVQYLV